MNRCVIDASALVKLVVPETDSEAMHTLAACFRNGQIQLLAPDYILVECANVLWKYARQTQTPESDVREAFQVIRRLGVELVPQVLLLEAALSLALEHKQPVYDALYLALAHQENAALITADERLANTVATQGFSIVLLSEWRPTEEH